MHFSQKFLLVNFVALLFFVAVNTFALRYFTSVYFSDYLAAIESDRPDVSYDALAAFLQSRDLDSATVREYLLILRDLTSLSRSLKHFADNPSAGNGTPIEPSDLSGAADSISPFEHFSPPALLTLATGFLRFSFDTSSPEGIFIWRILRSMLAVNAALIAFLSVLFYVWVRLSFSPIRPVIENVSNIVSKGRYGRIPYDKHDEFSPLVEAINALNEGLARQERIRSDFLSDFSHEIKTPIAAIKCYLDGMRDGIISPDPYNLELLSGEIDRLIATTNAVMEYERLEHTESTDIRRTQIDTIDLLRFVVLEHTRTLRDNQQTIDILRRTPYIISVDRDRWISLLHNIVSNFLKYAGESATLRISTFDDSGWRHIRFSDNGLGVPRSEVSRLREKFYRVEKSRTRGSGAGIGLSLVERIVLLHGGTVHIDSDENRGFTIEVRIPVADTSPTFHVRSLTSSGSRIVS